MKNIIVCNNKYGYLEIKKQEMFALSVHTTRVCGSSVLNNQSADNSELILQHNSIRIHPHFVTPKTIRSHLAYIMNKCGKN